MHGIEGVVDIERDAAWHLAKAPAVGIDQAAADARQGAHRADFRYARRWIDQPTPAGIPWPASMSGRPVGRRHRCRPHSQLLIGDAGMTNTGLSWR